MNLRSFALAAAVLLAAAGVAPAQTAAVPTPATPAAAAPHDWMEDVKHPVDWLTWGGELRVRNEYYDTAVSLAEGAPRSVQDVLRFRGRLWTTATPLTNVALNARVAAEPRLWFHPSFTSGFPQSGMEWRYGIVDSLNVSWKEPLAMPLNLTVGRQDLTLGDGTDPWLVGDGTPCDGSWTAFLDGAKASLELKEAYSRVDLAGVCQQPLPDAWLPTIGDSDSYALTDQREQGVLLYVSNHSLETLQLNGFFFYKHDDRVLTGRGDNADLYTPGLRLVGAPSAHWRYSVEGAYQLGWKEDRVLGVFASREVQAYAGRGRLSYLLGDRWQCQAALVGEVLSGDDPASADQDEMFDVLWGRWPTWSDLYSYSYIPETSGRISQMNNLARFGPAWSMSPLKGLTLSATYNPLFALEETPTRATAPPRFSGDGHFRGHFFQALAKHQFNKNLRGHLWGEWVWEGDYYAQRDVMSFIRAELQLTF